MLRRSKAEVLPSLPSKFRSVVELSPQTDFSEVIHAEWGAFERWMEQKDGDGVSGNGDSSDNYQLGVRRLRRFQGCEWNNLALARHETARAKVPLVSAFIRELFENGSGK
jgi:hypothetical protein